MKKFVLFLTVILIITACEKVNLIDDQEKSWTKKEINSNENLKKIIVMNNNLFIFSDYNLYISNDLTNWESIPIPERKEAPNYLNTPYPVVFKGNLFIDGQAGLYKLNLSNLSWELIKEINTSAIASDNNYLYLFSIYGSYRTSDALNFEPLPNLDEMTKHNLRQAKLLISYAKGDEEKIILAGYWHTAMAYVFSSYNQGIDWEIETKLMINDFYKNQSVVSNHARITFYAIGDLNFQKLGGNFLGLTKYNNNYYFVGHTNRYYENEDKRELGLIVKNDFENVVYFNEVINKIDVFNNTLIAITNDGYIYYKNN